MDAKTANLNKQLLDTAFGHRKAAIAAAEQAQQAEPVAWCWQFPDGVFYEVPHHDQEDCERDCAGYDGKPVPLYAAQPPAVADRDAIRRIFMAHGFTIKEGQTDLKPYVYEAAEALLRELSPAVAVAEPVALEPVEGDLLPAVGDTVLIHLSRPDGWFPHRVVGYYAWGDRSGSKSLYRVFVRVVDAEGYLNARPLDAIRRLGKKAAAAEGCGACGDGCKGQGCRLERESPPTCQTCNGKGMIGGLLPNGGGYDGEPCPDCCAPQDVAKPFANDPPEYLAAGVYAPPLSAALADIAAERRRQMEAEGWTPEHDDQHSEGQLEAAAASYAIDAACRAFGGAASSNPPRTWPWSQDWWKPTTARRNLVKSAALCAAAIERIDRAAQKGGAA